MLSLGVRIAGVLTLAAMLAGYAAAEEKGEKGKVGEKAPAFQSVDENGKEWKSKDVVGKKVLVLYFYPADFTGGCTAQACGFRDDFAKFKEADVEVVGVSGDAPKTHAAFKKHHKLPFTLLADEKGEVAKKFGVPVNKGGVVTIAGDDGSKTTLRRGSTISRVTVVIDKDGKIAYNASPKKAGADSKTIQEVVSKLSK